MFADGDEFLFELKTLNFWLRVNFKLKAPHINNSANLENNSSAEYIEGNTELRIDWNEKMATLRKKL